MAVTEHCGNDSPHAGHTWSDRDGDHWCPGSQGGGRD
jgi:hypothetical protein